MLVSIKVHQEAAACRKIRCRCGCSGVGFINALGYVQYIGFTDGEEFTIRPSLSATKT